MEEALKASTVSQIGGEQQRWALKWRLWEYRSIVTGSAAVDNLAATQASSQKEARLKCLWIKASMSGPIIVMHTWVLSKGGKANTSPMALIDIKRYQIDRAAPPHTSRCRICVARARMLGGFGTRWSLRYRKPQLKAQTVALSQALFRYQGNIVVLDIFRSIPIYGCHSGALGNRICGLSHTQSRSRPSVPCSTQAVPCLNCAISTRLQKGLVWRAQNTSSRRQALSPYSALPPLTPTHLKPLSKPVRRRNGHQLVSRRQIILHARLIATLYLVVGF